MQNGSETMSGIPHGELRRSTRVTTQTQFYGQPVNSSEIPENIERTAVLHQFYTFSERTDDLHKAIDSNFHYNIIIERFNHLAEEFKKLKAECDNYLMYTADPGLEELLEDTRKELELLHTRGKALKATQKHFNMSMHRGEDISRQYSQAAQAKNSAIPDQEDDDRQSTTTSHASKTSSASKAKAEAARTRLRLQQLEDEAQMQFKLDKLKLENQLQRDEMVATMLEEDNLSNCPEVKMERPSYREKCTEATNPSQVPVGDLLQQGHNPMSNHHHTGRRTQKNDEDHHHHNERWTQKENEDHRSKLNPHHRDDRYTQKDDEDHRPKLSPRYHNDRETQTADKETLDPYGELFNLYLPGLGPDRGPVTGHALPQRQTKENEIQHERRNEPPPYHQVKQDQFRHQYTTVREMPPVAPTYDKSTRLMFLNSIQPVRFGGKPKDFPAFKERVDSLLGDGVLSTYEAVEMLPKFMEGEPSLVVKNMVGRSYDTIMQRLEERYGHPTMVANDHIHDMTSGPVIQASDRKGLLSFADSVITASDTLKGHHLAAASCQPNMEKIVNRLPQHLRQNWENKVSEICEEKPAPELHDLAKFIDKAAKAKNNPFYQAQPRPEWQTRPQPIKSSFYGSGRQNKPLVAMGTDVEQKRKLECLVCAENHVTWSCPTLRAAEGPEREKLLRNRSLCIVCFMRGCRHSTCPRRDSRFVCQKCDMRHHRLLDCHHFVKINSLGVNDDDKHEEQSGDESTEDKGDCQLEDKEEVVVSHAIGTGPTNFMLGLIPVNVHGTNGKIVSTYAFLDSGSKGSFIDKSLAAELSIDGPKEHRTVKTILGCSRQTMKKVSFTISNIKTGTSAVVDWQTFMLTDSSLEDKLHEENLLPSSLSLCKFAHLSKLHIPVPQHNKIELLIGLPIREAHEVIRYFKGASTEPFGIETILGVAVAGPISESCRQNPSLGVNVTAIVQDPPMSKSMKALCDPSMEANRELSLDLLQEFWRFQDYGTNYDPKNALSPADRRALDIFFRTLRKRDDGHYECGLMWQKDDFTIPQNRHIALAKLKTLLKKFKKNPQFEVMYRKNIQECLDNGWASVIPEEEIDTENDRTCYLSHFGVSNPNKPGKLRTVFNAAEEYRGVSLNSLLIGGPDTSCSLIGVLLRARFGRFCVAADVRAMFNQCYVRPEDRDSLRFLWSDEDGNIRDYRMNVHIFGAADSPFCANKILKQIGLDHKSEYQPEVIAALADNFYVDDGIITSGSIAKMTAMTLELKSLLEEGGMKLTKFTTNNKEVLRALDPEDWAKPNLDLDLDPLPIERALGLQWNATKDCFGYKISRSERPDSLRGMTSTVARIYDPIGGTAPVTLTPKCLIQECWRRKLTWDEELPDDILKSWKLWKRDFHQLERIEIPRPYFPNVDDCREGLKLQLHLCADSSGFATGAAAYLRGEERSGKIHLAFVMGKSKLLPLHPVLYQPRGELKAAVDILRLSKKLESELRLPLQPTQFWVDSMLVLQYIASQNGQFKPFVANRCSEILEGSKPEQWRKIPGKWNVADDASRGVKIADYHSSHRFLTGPSFLLRAECEWPPTEISPLPPDDPEIKKSKSPSAVMIAATSLCPNDHIVKLIQDRSDVNSLKTTVAWWVRLYHYANADVANKTKSTNADISHPGPSLHAKPVIGGSLTVEELEHAENRLVYYVQRKVWAAETNCLIQNKALPSHSNILKLTPILDSPDLLRVGGRLSQAPLDYAVRHPLILPSPTDKSIPEACRRLSKLLLFHIHVSLLHAGQEMTLAKSREKFWIIHARSYIRTMISECVTCRRRNARPVLQRMADLPPDRVDMYLPPFTNTGTDCFGPFLCKSGRRRDLRYFGVLFMCLNTKAIHIERVKSLSTDDFIQALMCFTALRPSVRTIRSDNGSNYIGAERELRTLVSEWNTSQIEDNCRVKAISWTFQPPYGSSMSGIWERKIKEAKRHIYAVLKNQQLDPEALRAFLYEVSNIMNQTPLCPVSDDPDSLEVLTPAHFLLQKPASTLAPVPTSKLNYYRKTWRQIQCLSDLYWKKHIKSVVPTLLPRQKWLKTHRNLQKDDLVLLTHMELPRCRWVYGRIIETFPGRDGLVRTVKVRTKNGEYLRPIHRVALISATVIK